MKQPPSTAEKLRILFRTALRKGFVRNTELDPVLPPSFRLDLEPDETFIVRIDSTKGVHYWFSDRRLIEENADTTPELLRHEAIQATHWMFSDLTERLKRVRSSDEVSAMKIEHYDRLEIELPTGSVVLEGLGQAYRPVLNFFRWATKPGKNRTT